MLHSDFEPVRLRRLVAVFAVAALLLPGGVARPAQLSAQQSADEEELRACVDDAQLSLNDCLMSNDCWLSRKLCDIEFLMAAVVCAAQAT